MLLGEVTYGVRCETAETDARVEIQVLGQKASEFASPR
jgi:hypothetical protein